MDKYTNEPFLRAEHLLRDGSYVSPTVEIESILIDVPLMRKKQAYSGIALKFSKSEKVLGLGITNESLLTVICGDSQPEKWIGCKVKLEVREVNSASGGKEPAIRIMPPAGTKMRSGLARQLGSSYSKE